MGDIFQLHLFLTRQKELQNDVILYPNSVYRNNFGSLCLGLFRKLSEDLKHVKVY